MGYRWFNAVVVLFWLSTMTWLVVVKVLPPLQIGDPPNYRSVYKIEKGEQPKPVCWDMLWNDRPIGWAENRVERTPAGVTEVRSLVHFERVPVEEVCPRSYARRCAVLSIWRWTPTAVSRSTRWVGSRRLARPCVSSVMR